MIRFLFVAFVVSCAFVVLSFYFPAKAIVSLSYQEWVLDVPVNILLPALVALVIAVMLLQGVFVYLVVKIKGLYCSLFKLNLQQASKKTEQGMLALVQGYWLTAEKLLLKSANASPVSKLNYLLAAQAAHSRGDFGARDKYINFINSQDKSIQISLALLQAEYLYMQGSFSESLQKLDSIKTLAHRHPQRLKLLEKLYMATGNSHEMLSLLPRLQKYAGYSAAVWRQLAIDSYKMHCKKIATQGKAELLVFWQQVPLKFKKNTTLIYCYAKSLLQFRAYDEVERLLSISLTVVWDNDLVLLYGLSPSSRLDRQINRAELWLKQHPDNENLLLSLGRLCVSKQLWGKAKQYFMHSAELCESPIVYAELGKVFAHLGELQSAHQYYSKCLTDTQMLQLDELYS